MPRQYVCMYVCMYVLTALSYIDKLLLIFNKPLLILHKSSKDYWFLQFLRILFWYIREIIGYDIGLYYNTRMLIIWVLNCQVLLWYKDAFIFCYYCKTNRKESETGRNLTKKIKFRPVSYYKWAVFENFYQIPPTYNWFL